MVPVLRVLGAAGNAVLRQLRAASRCPSWRCPRSAANGYHAVTVDGAPAALRAADDAHAAAAGDRAAAPAARTTARRRHRPPPADSRLPWPPPPGARPRPASRGCPTPWIGCCAPRACSRARGSSRGPLLPSTAAAGREAHAPAAWRLLPGRRPVPGGQPAAAVSDRSDGPAGRRLPRVAGRGSTRPASTGRPGQYGPGGQFGADQYGQVSTRPGSTGRDQYPADQYATGQYGPGGAVRSARTRTGPACSSARTGRRSATRSGR